MHALDAGGHGIARNAEGKVVFVEGALAGETVEARLTREKPKFDEARAVRILEAASGRRPQLPDWAGDLMAREEVYDVMPADLRAVEDAIEARSRAVRATF